MMTLASIAMSCGITVAMSVVFNGKVRGDMLATGLICALVIDRIIDRISGHYRANLERRVAERTCELAAARDELMLRDRMATAGMLAAGIGHEIRSPLGVIQIVGEELRETLSPSSETDGMLADLLDASERIATIVRDLSTLARPVDDPLGPVDLAQVVDSASRLAAYKLGRRTSLVKRGPLTAPPVFGNASRLVQLVLNLLVNAARATRDDVPNTITISVRDTSTGVVLSVADTGTGMTPEVRARVFEPFFTTGRHSGGTGLGLTICRSIVERMGGAIALDSAPNAGTTIEVTLPRA